MPFELRALWDVKGRTAGEEDMDCVKPYSATRSCCALQPQSLAIRLWILGLQGNTTGH